MERTDTYREIFSEKRKEAEELEEKLKPRIEEIDNRIEGLRKKTQANRDRLIKISKKKKECKAIIAEAEESFFAEAIVYLHEKLQEEREGKSPIIQLDEDKTVGAIEDKRVSVEHERRKVIENLNSEKALREAEIKKNNEEICNLEKQKEKLMAPLEKLRKEALASGARWVDAMCEEYSIDVGDDDEPSYTFDDDYSARSWSTPASSYSSSYSSSYEEDRYAREQAEAAREQAAAAKAQAEEARKQTQLAERQLREMQKQKLKADEEARKRMYEEFQQQQRQNNAIYSRCSSCKVVGCGMRFNKSNVNCAAYRPR